MAFRLPSLVAEYPLVFSGDPALELPAIPELTPESTPEVIKQAQERDTQLRVARETGDWPRITRSGEQPTVFWCRQIHGMALTWLQGEAVRGELGNAEGTELAFRLALVRVENLGGLKVKTERFDDQVLVSETTLNTIYDIGRDANLPELGRAIVLELGGLALLRAMQGVPPKS